MNRSSRTTGWKLAVVLVAVVFQAASAGDLEPPGPPAPTMRTLDEIDPRIPIRQADIPLTIVTPGSYYLTESLLAGGFGVTAITISSDDVTIDLNGFAISDTQVGQFDRGIHATSGVENVFIRDGVVKGSLQDGLELSQADRVRVVHVTASNNGTTGIGVGAHSEVIGCIAGFNGSGIVAGSGSVIVDSVAEGNGTDGISATFSRVENCMATSNGGFGIESIEGTVIGCTATFNGAEGIDATNNALVSHNTVRQNDRHGIAVGASSTVVGNNCSFNGANGTGAGIFVSGDNNRIEGNNVVSNDTGINATGINNVIVANTAAGNIVNYNNALGNDVGPIGNAATATSPWANISN